MKKSLPPLNIRRSEYLMAVYTRTVYPRWLPVNCDTQYVSRQRTHNLVLWLVV